MPFASTMGTGMCMAFPDVCKTSTPVGPVPIPYPNIAQLAMANPATCALTVLIFNKPAATTMTMIMLSSGDEAGCAGGVISSLFIGPARFHARQHGCVDRGRAGRLPRQPAWSERCRQREHAGRNPGGSKPGDRHGFPLMHDSPTMLLTPPARHPRAAPAP